jgi:hypothetical protein
MKTSMRSPRVKLRLIAAIRATPGDRSSSMGGASSPLPLSATSAGVPRATVVVFVVGMASRAMMPIMRDSDARSDKTRG